MSELNSLRSIACAASFEPLCAGKLNVHPVLCGLGENSTVTLGASDGMCPKPFTSYKKYSRFQVLFKDTLCTRELNHN